MRDLLSLPKVLADIDSVADEYKSLYEWDGDGWVLTQTAAGDFDALKGGITRLAAERDVSRALRLLSLAACRWCHHQQRASHSVAIF